MATPSHRPAASRGGGGCGRSGCCCTLVKLFNNISYVQLLFLSSLSPSLSLSTTCSLALRGFCVLFTFSCSYALWTHRKKNQKANTKTGRTRRSTNFKKLVSFFFFYCGLFIFLYCNQLEFHDTFDNDFIVNSSNSQFTCVHLRIFYQFISLLFVFRRNLADS